MSWYDPRTWFAGDSNKKGGELKEGPWVDYEQIERYAGTQKVYSQEYADSFWKFSPYKEEHVFWKTDYDVYRISPIDIEVAGKGAVPGTSGRGKLLTLFIRYWDQPRVSDNATVRRLADDGKAALCRKEIRCKAKCGACDGEETWTVTWKPGGYVYGKLESYDLAGRPYCNLFDDEQKRAEEACETKQAEKLCE